MGDAVGVCNYNIEQMQELHGLLAARGIPLVSNQVGFLCSRPQNFKGIWSHGLACLCTRQGISDTCKMQKAAVPRCATCIIRSLGRPTK